MVIRASVGWLSLMLTAWCALGVSFAHAAPYGGFDAKAPAARSGETDRSALFLRDASPGSVIEDGVIVVNESSKERVVSVFAVDTEISRDGVLSCKERARDGVGSWVSVHEDLVTVVANENTFVPFTVSVPENAEPGEHTACIVIEEQGVGKSYSAGIALKERVSIHLILSVPGKVVRELRDPSLVIVAQDEDRSVAQVSVRNSGTVSVATDVSVVTRSFPFSPFPSRVSDQLSVPREGKKKWDIAVDRSPWGGLVVATARFSYIGGNGLPREVTLETLPTYHFIAPKPWVLAFEGLALVLLILLCLVVLNWRRRARRAAKLRLVREKMRQLRAKRRRRGVV